MKCPYCDGPTERVGGEVIYPHREDLYHKRFILCRPCWAYVGCHEGGTPFGRLADAKLRRAKMRAHATFDPIWKSGSMKRGEAYAWLAEKMKLNIDNTHIGMFDLEQCAEVVRLCTGGAK